MDRRRVGSVLLGLGILLAVVIGVSAVIGSGGGFTEPSEAERERVIEIEQIASSAKLDVPSALSRPGDGAHPDPLVDIDRIRSGGPPPDGIPPIDRPFFERVDDVDWLSSVEPVVVLTVEGPDRLETRIYPIQVLTWHEIVNDTVAGVPVTVSFCPLCNSAVAYDRRVGDLIVDFGTSGQLLNSSLVMYDRQTESLWTHFDGRAVVGHLTGAELDLIPLRTLSWAAAAAEAPDALVLSRVTGYQRSYGSNPYPGYDDAGERPILFDGPIDDRLRAKDRVVVARSDGGSVTLLWDVLVAEGVVAAEVGGRTALFVHRPGTASALDTSQIAEGRDVGAAAVYWLPAGASLSEQASADPISLVLDRGELATWSFDGSSLGDHPALEPVEHLDTFWFAIAAFDPGTTLVLTP